MSAQVELVLRSRLKSDQVSVFIEPTSIPLAGRWIQALKKSLASAPVLEKNFCFMGFPDSARDQAFIYRGLNELAETLSAYRGKGPWSNGYLISDRCDPRTPSQEILNRFHHHFELLMGQVWNTSPYYNHASVEIRQQIRQLNFLVHELEHLEHSLQGQRNSGTFYPVTIVSFLGGAGAVAPLKDEDYQDFSFDYSFGAVKMHYCQTGKPFQDAWRDGDQNIHDSNINGLRYYSGEFVVNWGAGLEVNSGNARELYKDFYDWLGKQGIFPEHPAYFVDRNGVKQGLGFPTVGRFPLRQFGDRSVGQVHEWLAAYNDIYRIRVHEDGAVTEQTFDYFEEDSAFSRLVLESL